ncbi:MAG: type IV toxin-antitoxin system AbiEi family antitoxin domain-containing protein [Thermoleophilaceae bacterium]
MATRAPGVVTRTELLAGGITPGEIKRRLRTGALIPVYRGVYRVGHRAPGLESDYMAAVRAYGDGAVLGGRAAGDLLYLLRGRPPAPEVIAPTERRVKGVTIRRYTYGDVLEDPALMLAELRPGLRLDEAAADRIAHQLHAVAHLQLREQVCPV